MKINELNDQQKEAILESDGPTLVVAGAGSGKTRVLTHKIAYLINSGVRPYNILAITFTNKAANEMKTRIFEMLNENSQEATISTFHSFGLRILRREITKLGYKNGFTILDSNDQVIIVKRIIKEMNLDSKKYNCRNILSIVSKMKNEQLSIEKLKKENLYDNNIISVCKQYCDTLYINNCVDFDDLLVLPLKLFENFREVLDRYQNIYRYILVDEYQDTNQVQYKLVKLLGDKYKNIFVVGDGDQSIYSWRGADMSNILNFEKDYPNANVILLEQNYRSSKSIIAAANEVIKYNTNRKHKNLYTNNEKGDLLEYSEYESDIDEANEVVGNIIKLCSNKVLLNDIAILYRTNAQSRIFEEVLLQENIAYNIVGSYYFYARKEIKDLIAYLKLITNLDDDISFRRVVNSPKRGIGYMTIEKLGLVANKNSLSLMETIKLDSLSDKMNEKLFDFNQIIRNLVKYSKNNLVSDTIKKVLLDTKYKEQYNDLSIESQTKLEYIDEFLNIAISFESENDTLTLEEFLDQISLVADIKQYDDVENKLTLMTLHSAKGLEYDYVFMVGMEEELFPHRNSIDKFDELEEERRLCYVGITRTKKKLYLSRAKRRAVYGSVTFTSASRFIDEIGNDLIEKNGEVLIKKVGFDKKEYNLEFDADRIQEGTLKVSDKVNHKMYGDGMVVEIDGDIITVAFAIPHGIKKINFQFKSLIKK
ncbi:MAG: ATP-dependent helicase [Bacilli bacterium]